MSTASWELQKAILAALEADSALASAMGGTVRFFDYITEDAAMPFIRWEGGQAAEWDATGTEVDSEIGKEHSIELHIFSDYEGTKEIEAILGEIERILHNGSLTLTGHRLVHIRMTFQDRFQEQDRQAYHGVLQLRAVTEAL